MANKVEVNKGGDTGCWEEEHRKQTGRRYPAMTRLAAATTQCLSKFEHTVQFGSVEPHIVRAMRGKRAPAGKGNAITAEEKELTKQPTN